MNREHAAFVCSHIVNRTEPVRLVSHEINGDWQFLCGNRHPTAEVPKVLGVNHLVERDETLNHVLDLPRGWEAERSSVDSEWTRIRLPGQHEQLVSYVTERVRTSKDGGALRELQNDLTSGGITPDPESNVYPAEQAATVFAGGTKDIGQDTHRGFEQTVRALQELPPKQLVRLFGFFGSSRRFIVFVDERDHEIVGCIRVDRKPKSD